MYRCHCYGEFFCVIYSFLSEMKKIYSEGFFIKHLIRCNTFLQIFKCPFGKKTFLSRLISIILAERRESCLLKGNSW